MLNAICEDSSCGSKFLADDADTYLQTKRKQLPTLARKALNQLGSSRSSTHQEHWQQTKETRGPKTASATQLAVILVPIPR
jgi:hypothetical protein